MYFCLHVWKRGSGFLNTFCFHMALLSELRAWSACSLLLGVSKDSQPSKAFVNHAIQQFINSESSSTIFKNEIMTRVWTRKRPRTLYFQYLYLGTVFTEVGRNPNQQNTLENMFIFFLTTVVTKLMFAKQKSYSSPFNTKIACTKCVLSAKTSSLSNVWQNIQIYAFPHSDNR